MKRINLYGAMICLTTLFFGCINVFKRSDLRTEVSKQQVKVEVARAMVLDMGKAHGIENWDKMDTYTVLFEDEFFGFLGRYASPYRNMSNLFTLHYIPNTFDGALIFKSGKKKGLVWGIQSWNTYEVNEVLDTVFKVNKDAEFWIPTYQYFIEFPARIQNASAVKYAGELMIDGVKCKGIVASWGKIEPQKNIDQYVIWIDSETSRIIKLEYTIRDINKFITGATYFKDYILKEGLLLPSKLTVESNLLKKGYLHEMRILNFSANEINRDRLEFGKELINSSHKKY